ncbi:hypothetical protein [Streptomyces sp. G-G2]|uniref:hypothetical protein n=1 Tax=Streptomyces sp. G-G2 TaxID=3046201 RepID=UPI0024BBBE55|nr:hypothetical protein [Streptomyces sp. G-G2]MDJ0384532.1 hypothetical protein [Streptomyces sp. G-G2]
MRRISLLMVEGLRMRVGQVAVPFGICAEPSNVKAGGHACPFRFRCLGTRRRRRVLAALDVLTRDGQPISVSAVARPAGVHRSLNYRRGDVHAAVVAQAAQPLDNTTGPQVTRNSLLSDLANLAERNTRPCGTRRSPRTTPVRSFGQDAWRASGLGAPTDTDTLKRKIDHLEQQVVELRDQLSEREEDLQASRATNRERMTQLNSIPHRSR